MSTSTEIEKKPAHKRSAVAKKEPVVAVVEDAGVEAGSSTAEVVEVKKLKEGEYVYAIGRRKRAIAKTRLWTGGKGEITVNGKDYAKYFPVYELRETIIDPLRVVGQDDKVTIKVETLGGGMRGQAEAIRLGISRALLELSPNYRKSLKKLGYLERDAREKERKHYGFKKARKGSQWAKR